MTFIKKTYTRIMVVLCVGFGLLGCTHDPVNTDDRPDPTPNPDDQPYVPPVIETREGGYWMPYLDKKPAGYWNVTDLFMTGQQNTLTPSIPTSGRRNYLLFQSMAGLAHRAIANGSNDVALWEYSPYETNGYAKSHKALDDMGIKCLGNISAKELAMKSNGEGAIRNLFSGYVLTDLENNPESAIYAANASHVYSAIIVDEKDKDDFDAAGYEMICDAREKTTVDAFNDFKDKCKNNALVLMHVETGELRSFGIANDLFIMNINKFQNQPIKGHNWDLFYEVLEWLEPNSPVYGWDMGNDEGRIAQAISIYGNHAVPYDWGYNTTLTSLMYPERKQNLKAKSIDPSKIDYSNRKKLVSYYLSDGDNVQWTINDFEPWWWDKKSTVSQKFSYGLPVANLGMTGPAQLAHYFDEQTEASSIFERSSYFFIDSFGKKKDRKECLWQMAVEQAAHMKQNNIKILGMVTRKETDSEEAKEGYQALIWANEELEGIVTIAYSPYAKSDTEIMWFQNSKGIDIPVINTTYCIWNCGNSNHIDEGTPCYIANKMKKSENRFNLVCVHCWSQFQDMGQTNDELAENLPQNVGWNDPNIKVGADAAELCSNHLDLENEFEIVNMQELIWHIRMEYRPDQTKELLRL